MISKAWLVKVLNDTDYFWGKVFLFATQFLIILSLITFSIDTLPDLPAETRKILKLIDVFTFVAFSIEYLLRVLTAKKKLRFVFSFYGIIDLIAILPFYIASGVDLRAVRAFRLLRLVRILEALKYNQATNRFRRALVIAKEELVLFSIVATIMLYLSAVGIYYCENAAQPEKFKSVFHSLWWAVTTLTTVGYGDVYPITVGGKVLTFFILTIGLSIVAVPAGLIASALSQARTEELKRAKVIFIK